MPAVIRIVQGTGSKPRSCGQLRRIPARSRADALPSYAFCAYCDMRATRQGGCSINVARTSDKLRLIKSPVSQVPGQDRYVSFMHYVCNSNHTRRGSVGPVRQFVPARLQPVFSEPRCGILRLRLMNYLWSGGPGWNRRSSCRACVALSALPSTTAASFSFRGLTPPEGSGGRSSSCEGAAKAHIGVAEMMRRLPMRESSLKGCMSKSDRSGSPRDARWRRLWRFLQHHRPPSI